MSNRKETPDVLGEIFGNPSKPTPSVSATPAPISVDSKAEAQATSKAAPSNVQSKPKRKASTQKSAAAKPSIQWEYMEVIFREFRGWRPRYVNGAELDDWKEQPEIGDYLNQMGQEGWEMVGIVNSRRNMRDVYFKRQVN